MYQDVFADLIHWCKYQATFDTVIDQIDKKGKTPSKIAIGMREIERFVAKLEVV